MKTRNRMLVLAGLAGGTFGLYGALAPTADAADHAEAPGASADQAADIGDFFAWHTADSVVAIITYNPFMAAGGAALYDGDVNYVVHIDNDGDLANGAEHQIDVRFGQNGDGDWGVRAKGLPGSTEDLVGAVGENLAMGDYELYAGATDDPFFFDQAGFLSTLDLGNADGSVDFAGLTGTPVDALAGLNVMSIVLEFPRAAAADGADTLNLWATTGRTAPQ